MGDAIGWVGLLLSEVMSREAGATGTSAEYRGTDPSRPWTPVHLVAAGLKRPDAGAGPISR